MLPGRIEHLIKPTEASHGPDAERLVTVRDLAEYLRVTPQSLYDLRRYGRGPRGFRVGRDLRFAWSDVQAWLESRRDAS